MSGSIAALPMYDWPELQAGNDAAWAAIRDRLRAGGIDAPQKLARERTDLQALWRDPALLLSQTCWGPMELGLARHVRVVGQPDYSAYEGGEGEFYSSAIVMRAGDGQPGTPHPFTPPSVLPDISPTRGEIGQQVRRRATSNVWRKLDGQPISPHVGEMSGRTEGGTKGREHQAKPNVDTPGAVPINRLRNTRLAFNSTDSRSGYLGLKADLEAAGEGLSLFSALVETGGHRASIRVVAEGRADVAAIDCKTWHLARLHEPAARGLVVVGWTGRRPGLPFITARGTSDTVAEALAEALAALPPP